MRQRIFRCLAFIILRVIENILLCWAILFFCALSAYLYISFYFCSIDKKHIFIRIMNNIIIFSIFNRSKFYLHNGFSIFDIFFPRIYGHIKAGCISWSVENFIEWNEFSLYIFKSSLANASLSEIFFSVSNYCKIFISIHRKTANYIWLTFFILLISFFPIIIPTNNRKKNDSNKIQVLYYFSSFLLSSLELYSWIKSVFQIKRLQSGRFYYLNTI